MHNHFRSSWWSIQLAPSWLVEEDETCASFWREDGVGAFQISALKHDSGSVPANDLDDLMKGEFPEKAAVRRVRCGEFDGVGVDYVSDGKFWRKWLLTSGPLLIFVTYNSDEQDQAVEKETVDQMLGTLRCLYKRTA